MRKSRGLIADLKREQQIRDDIRAQSSPCPIHPDAFVEVEFRVRRSWRGWLCFCTQCQRALDEFYDEFYE